MALTSISKTSLEKWLACGIAFENQYIRGMHAPMGIAAIRGVAFHAGAEADLRSRAMPDVPGDAIDPEEARARPVAPLDVIQDACRDKFVSLVGDGVYIPASRLAEKESLLNEALNQALEACALYREQIAPNVLPHLVEVSLSEDIGLPLPLKAVLDCVEVDGRVTDLKLKRRQSQQWADRELQPTICSFLSHRRTGMISPGFRFWFVVPNKRMTVERLDTVRTGADLGRLRGYIDAFMRDLSTGCFRPADPGSWACSPDYCVYWDVCRFGGGN